MSLSYRDYPTWEYECPDDGTEPEWRPDERAWWCPRCGNLFERLEDARRKAAD